MLALRRSGSRRSRLAAAALVTAVAAAGLAGTAGVAGASPAAPQAPNAGHALIQGSGSSWAANAVNQWISDVHQNGLQVVFTSNGSAQGRRDFASKTVDYAVSDIGYQGTDSATQSGDTSEGRSYAYLPIVAGGTSFPYQLHGAGGALIRNLRLSGSTLLGIFTGTITNWDDPAIKADMHGDPQHELPNLQIIPVVHSEGSGSTYQFTKYLDTEFPSKWEAFSGGGATEYFPGGKGNEVSEDGSDQIANFITSKAGNGSIGFDEYSYALAKGYPVADVLNSAGYYTLPNQYNVAVALQKALINTDPTSPNYLLQDLHEVYTDSDSRTYPLSSYSYMIIPTAANDATMTTAKRQTIADFLYYSICQGQKETGPIGYSPLTVNLVQAGFNQIAKLHQADSGVTLNGESVTTCNNPTFIAGDPSGNYLAKVAPKPTACQSANSNPCTTNGNTGQVNPTGGKVATTGNVASNSTTSGTTSGGTTSSLTTSGGTTSGGTTSGGSTANGSTANGTSGTTGTSGAAGSDEAASISGLGGGSAVSAVSGGDASTVSSSQPATGAAGVPVAVIAALLLLALLVAPPVMGIALSRRKR